MRTARLLFTVDDEAAIYVNGTEVVDTKAKRDADENAWQKAVVVDLGPNLHAGANTIAVQVKNRVNVNGAQTPGGFIARLRATFASGNPVTLDTGSELISGSSFPVPSLAGMSCRNWWKGVLSRTPASRSPYWAADSRP